MLDSAVTRFDWQQICAKSCPYHAYGKAADGEHVCLKPECYEALQKDRTAPAKPRKEKRADGTGDRSGRVRVRRGFVCGGCGKCSKLACQHCGKIQGQE